MTDTDRDAWTLTPATAARALGVSPDTIKLWADKGQIPCWRTPTGHRRFRQVDIDALLELGRT